MRNLVASYEDWFRACLELFAADKEFTRQVMTSSAAGWLCHGRGLKGTTCSRR